MSDKERHLYDHGQTQWITETLHQAKQQVGATAKNGSPNPHCKSGRLIQRSVKSGKNVGKLVIACAGYPKRNHFSRPST